MAQLLISSYIQPRALDHPINKPPRLIGAVGARDYGGSSFSRWERGVAKIWTLITNLISPYLALCDCSFGLGLVDVSGCILTLSFQNVLSLESFLHNPLHHIQKVSAAFTVLLQNIDGRSSTLPQVQKICTGKCLRSLSGWRVIFSTFFCTRSYLLDVSMF